MNNKDGRPGSIIFVIYHNPIRMYCNYRTSSIVGPTGSVLCVAMPHAALLPSPNTGNFTHPSVITKSEQGEGKR